MLENRIVVWQYSLLNAMLSGMETLTMILEVWEANPDVTIELTTHANDGKPLLQRIRTKLSVARKGLKKRGEPIARFTIAAEHQGMINMGQGRVDVLTLKFKTTIGHKIREDFDARAPFKLDESQYVFRVPREKIDNKDTMVGIDGKRKGRS